MDTTVSLNKIITEVKKLDKNEQVDLIKQISLLITKNESTSHSKKLAEISGLGAHIWSNVNIDKYVADERKW